MRMGEIMGKNWMILWAQLCGIIGKIVWNYGYNWV